MKDRLKKFWEDRKDYIKPAALGGALAVVGYAIVRGSHKEASPVMEDDSIKIDNWVDGEGRGLTVITEPNTEYDLPGWSPNKL